MLQISQTENPICSATIDQIRLRRATTLPVVFQNVSSSGFQSEIQVWFRVGFGVGIGLLIKTSFLNGVGTAYREIAREGMEARSGEAPVWRFTNRMIGFG